MIDFYKAVHSKMYPDGLEYITSYFTPRTCRIDDYALVNFGLQGFIKDYIESFNKNFFNKSMDEYFKVLNATLGLNTYDKNKIYDLLDLGYLPLKFSEIPEGTRVPIHCPMIEITNTVPGFAWVVGTIESAMSAYLWHMMVSASIGYKYRKLVNNYAKDVCDDPSVSRRILGDFSFRGQESPEAAILSSAGWLLSNVNTATVPAIVYLTDNYHADIIKNEVGFGAPSTEHSVMCSNYAADGNDEMAMIKRLLTEIYPTGYFTCVCDSYDYWNVVDNILPQLKNDIMSRNGCIGIRGDSGDPVEIVTETVFHLWDIFGGTINSKNMKVLNKHVKAVYGDSITLDKARKIFDILKNKGFSIENVSLGVGSFSLQCIEECGLLKPFTRDTYGLAMKSTHCVINEEEHFIYKDPKTDNGVKKSQKGLCVVLQSFDKKLSYCDELTISERDSYAGNCLQPLWIDGKFVHEYTLEEIRNNLWKGKFYEL